MELAGQDCPDAMQDLSGLDSLYFVKTARVYPFLRTLPALKRLIVEADPDGNFSLDDIHYLRQLQKLAINGPCQSLPDSLRALRRLATLGLKNTKLTSLPEFVSGFPALETLVLHNNRYISELPSSLRHAQALKHLIVEGGDSSAAFPAGMRHCPQIDLLRICSVAAPHPADLKPLRRLRSLTLDGVSSSDVVIRELPDLPLLERLRISSKDSLPSLKNAAAAGKFPALRELRLIGRNLRPTPNIAAFKQLRTLNIRGRDVDELVETICGCDSLENLSLWSYSMRRLPHCLSKLGKLRTLYIGMDSLYEFPAAILQLRNLRSLTIEGSLPESRLPEDLADMPALARLKWHSKYTAEVPSLLRDKIDTVKISLSRRPPRPQRVLVNRLHLNGAGLFAEIGYAMADLKHDREWGGYHAGQGILAASMEIKPYSNFTIAPKLAWYNTRWIFWWGLSALYYTDFNRGSFMLRPELGLYLGFVLSIGANIPLDQGDFDNIGGAVYSLSLFVPL